MKNQCDFIVTKAILLSAVALLTSNEARAQTDYIQLQPPIRPAPDPNGVNLLSGKLALSGEGISIGIPGQSSISNAPYIIADQYLYQSPAISFYRINMMDSLKGVAIIRPVYASNGTGYAKVNINIGIKSESFIKRSGSYQSMQGSSSSFNQYPQQVEYRLGNGSLALYLSLPYAPDDYYQGTDIINPTAYLISTLTKPDGEKLSYYYKTVTVGSGSYSVSTSILNSVVSSMGWMVKYDYDSLNLHLVKMTAINLAVDYCDPNVDTCIALSRSWPSIAFQDTVNGFTESNALGQSTNYSQTISNKQGNIFNLTLARTSPLSIIYSVMMRSIPVHYPNIQSSGGVQPSGGDRTIYQIIVDQAKLGNSLWIYNYTWGSDPWVQSPAWSNFITKTISTDPLGANRTVVKIGTVNYYFGVAMNPIGVSFFDDVRSSTDPLGRSTTYEYDLYGRITSVILPEGIKADYAYNGRGNVAAVTHSPKSGSGLATANESAGYDATCGNAMTCNQPNYLIDAGGNRTDFTYDAIHGGILTQTGPADANGVRPQTRHTYAQLTPRMKNAAGTLMNSTPVWRLVRTSVCASATSGNPASCVDTAAETVTSYAYGTNNLLPTSVTVAAGDGSASTTTTKSYDDIGNVVSVDGPRTDIDDRSYTTYDALRRPVFEIGADPDGAGPLPRLVTRHLYDADRHEYRTETGTSNALDGADFVMTRYVAQSYDAMTGLLVKTTVGAP